MLPKMIFFTNVSPFFLLCMVPMVSGQWDWGDCPQESNDIKYYYCPKKASAFRVIQARGGDGTCHSHRWSGPFGENDGGCMYDGFSGLNSQICVDPGNKRAHWTHLDGDKRSWCYDLHVKKNCAFESCDCYYAVNVRDC
jgi:hypothetical protein